MEFIQIERLTLSSCVHRDQGRHDAAKNTACRRGRDMVRSDIVRILSSWFAEQTIVGEGLIPLPLWRRDLSPQDGRDIVHAAELDGWIEVDNDCVSTTQASD